MKRSFIAACVNWITEEYFSSKALNCNQAKLVKYRKTSASTEARCRPTGELCPRPACAAYIRYLLCKRRSNTMENRFSSKLTPDSRPKIQHNGRVEQHSIMATCTFIYHLIKAHTQKSMTIIVSPFRQRRHQHATHSAAFRPACTMFGRRPLPQQKMETQALFLLAFSHRCAMSLVK